MANTVPVLQIPVDDSQFQAFLETFQKFKLEAADVPNAMADIERAIDRLPEHLRPGTEALEEAAEGAANALEDADVVGGGGSGSGGGSGGGGSGRRKGGGKRRSGSSRKREAVVALDWVLAGTGAKRFASTISGATRDLARWEKLTGVFAGLLGAGGLYGLDVLAAGASRRRQESAGYGLSTGELASFQTNYGRLGDTSGVLAGLSGAETDFAKRQPLQSLGVDPRGKNSLAIFGEILPKLKTIADHTDPRTFGPAIQARGLDKIGIGVEMMRLIRSLPDEEIASLSANARRDANVLGIPDDVAVKWQELNTALHKAGARFQTVIADELVQLTPGLTHLSETATGLFDKLLARKELATFLTRTNDALLRFADDVGSDKAQTEIREFLHHFDMAKSDFDTLNRWVGDHGATLGAVFGAAVGARFGPMGALAGALGGAMVGGSATHGRTIQRQYEGGAAAERPTLEQRNLSRKGLGLPEYKDQAEYDKAEPSARGGSTTYDVAPADPSKPVPPLNLKGSPFAHPDVDDVDPRLREILAAGQTHLPPGYTMRVNEGYNPNGHAPGSQHHIRGKGALDVVIFGPDGKPIANQGDEGPNGPYHRLARASYGEMLARHPELNKTFAWGGGFDSGRGDVKQDLMHFDLGGERARRYPENAMSNMGPLPEQLAQHSNHAAYRKLVARLLATRGPRPTSHTEALIHEPNKSMTFTGPANASDRYAAMVRQRNNLQHMLDKKRLKGPGWESMLERENQWLKDNQVPAEMRRRHRNMVRGYLSGHPDARPKPPQTVVVSDNSGGSSTVVVAH